MQGRFNLAWCTLELQLPKELAKEIQEVFPKMKDTLMNYIYD